MKYIHGIQIYETLKEIVDPSHSCLVIWDVQNGLVDKIFNKDEFLSNTKNLIEAMRGRMPVAYSMITPTPKGFNAAWRYYSMLKRFPQMDINQIDSFMPIGSKERDIHGQVKPEASDIIIEKTSTSIFIGTNFEQLMRNRGITTLIFTGIATEIGVESSARDAASRGFFPVVVSDCVSSSDREAHERSLKNLAKVAIVETAENIKKAV